MSTALDLTAYSSIRQATFVKMTVIESGVPIIVRMSTNNVPVSIMESDGNSYSYVANGNLLNVTQIIADSLPTQNDVTVTLSGIGNQYISDILSASIKGNPIEIRRAFFNAQTGVMIAGPGNPVLEFVGVVNNYSFAENWVDGSSQSITTTISLICSSTMSILSHKITGRRTAPDDQMYWFPGDNSMNRVGVISDQVFDFGGSTPSITPVTAPGTTVTSSTK